MARRLRLAVVLAVLSLVVAACSSGDDPGPDRDEGRASSTTSSTAAEPSTTAGSAPATTTSSTAPGPVVASVNPPVTGPAQVRPGPARAAADSCPAVPERNQPRSDRPSYELTVDVRPAEGIVVGTQEVRFTPDLDVDQLVFRLWANAPRITRAGGRIDVSLEDLPGATQPNATTLVIPRAVRAGQSTTVSLSWQLTLPTTATNDRIARSGSSVRLGSFIPVLAWHPGLGWAMEPPTSGFAEASLSLPSDFSVDVTVPVGLQVLATGVPTGADGTTWVASGVPDWAMTVGDLRIVTGRAEGDVAVSVGVERAVGDQPQPYLDKVVAALNDFSRRFGPYPWPSYTLALTPDLSGGIEYPMHVMQGPGTLGRTTSHEVAHMWFYGLVATNQGATPWIDEGLATYAEGRFEGTLESLKAREVPAEGAGRAGEPMTFWESRQSAYYRSVYVQGAQAVAALGSADLVDCALRQLVARSAYRVVGNGEVIAALSVVAPDAAAVLGRYGIR
jgi:hypothetical protein